MFVKIQKFLNLYDSVQLAKGGPSKVHIFADKCVLQAK